MPDLMDTRSPSFATVSELLAWCERAPDGTHLDARSIADILASLPSEVPRSPATQPEPAEAPWTWRERLWTVPAETRLGVVEVAEAFGRPRSFVYARTGPKTEEPVPHRKLDGTLVFTAGELRAWIRAHEDVVVAGPVESSPAERGGLRAV